MVIVYIAVIIAVAYILIGWLIKLTIVAALSHYRCGCSQQRKIIWKVPFDPCWIFALSERERIHLAYSGKCGLCGRHHKALLEGDSITFISDIQGGTHENKMQQQVN